MKPAAFDYHTPATIDECTALMAEYGDDAVVISGGQSLVPLMRFRLAQPRHVISLREIGAPLDAIRLSQGSLYIGARVTYSALQRSTEVFAEWPALPKAIELVATPAVRSRGTVCGNLVNADPASELPAVALAMNARLHLRSANAERVVEAVDFFQGPYVTARRSDELLTAVEFPARPRGETFAILEISRLHGGFPLAGVAVAFVRGRGNSLSHIAVACFGVHAVQLRIPAAEVILESGGYTPTALAAACDAIDGAIEPHADPFGSVAYRRSATRTLFERAMRQAWHSENDAP